MKVHGIVWLGVETSRYAETLSFFRDLLGLSIAYAATDNVEFECPNGTRVQLFSSAADSCPVPLFEVDDVRTAKEVLESAGIRVTGSIKSDAAWEWIDVRGPDGRKYEFGSRRLR